MNRLKRLKVLLNEPFRFAHFSVIVIALLAIIFYIAPNQLGVIVDKLAIILLSGLVGYWLDRHLFPYARPHKFIVPDLAPDLRRDAVTLFTTSMLRRAIIVGACLVATALAL